MAVSVHASRPARTAPRGLILALITFSLIIAVMMDALNATLFSLARLHMAGDMASTLDEISWVNLSYMMAKMAALPAMAWCVDRWGERPLALASILLMTVGAIISISTFELVPFLTARILQGLGGAGILVAAQTLLFRLFPQRQQGLIQGLYALGAVMAPASLGPVIHGVLSEHYHWTWGLGLNLILAPLAFAGLYPFRETLKTLRTRHLPRFDTLGFMLFTLAMVGVIYVVMEGPRWNWFDDSHIQLWALIGLSAFALTLFWRVIGQRDSALIARSVFTKANFAFGFFVSFVAGFALFGSAFLIPAFAQKVLKYPPAAAGLLLLPTGLAVALGLAIAALLITFKRVSPIKFAPFGILLVMGAMAMLSGSNLNSGADDLGLALLLRGLGLGFLFLAITLVTLDALEPHQRASGVALFNWGRQMGGLIGISVLSTYLNHQIALNRRVLIENLNPANPLFQDRQASLIDSLTQNGLDPGLAPEASAKVIQSILQAQVGALSFNEAFFALVILFLVAAPVILAFKLTQKLCEWKA